MLIGLTGYAQHGKDSVAKVLVEDYWYTRIAFADPLKELAYRTDPFVPGFGQLQSIVDQEGWDRAKALPFVRRYLQELGTAARDILGEDVWVRAADLKVQQAPGPVVLSDVRFPNEAEYIHRHSGKVVGVHRPGFDNGLGIEHPSEAHIHQIPIDLAITNDGTLVDLKHKVHGVMNRMKETPAWASND